MVVAFAALFVAMTGTAVAGKVLDGGDIRNNSLTGKDIRDHSLVKKDFKSGQIPAGARGPQGAPGPQGPQGIAGAAGRAGNDGFGELSYAYNEITIPAGATDAVAAVCPSGTLPTGGDAGAFGEEDFVPYGDVISFDGYYWFDELPDAWAAFATNNTGVEVTVFVDAICANADTVTFGDDFKRKQPRGKFGLVPKRD